MSLNQDQLHEHCQLILKSRRIKNKIVILCEGDIHLVKGHPAPLEYGKMDKMPDANFYKACVPRWWTEYRPEFFNCGDCNDVTKTYFTLLKHHAQEPNISYLSPDKLFAIVDLDLQVRPLEQDYPFADTETIFNHLYHQAKVNEANAKQHRIWVTGFIHKEAYFIAPSLQAIFDDFPISPSFNGKSLQLTDLYRAMSNDLNQDVDLQNNFERACQRIQYCTALNCTEMTTLKTSWQQQFSKATDQRQKQALIDALLTIRKAKPYWKQIVPEPNGGWTREDDGFRDQIALEIGRFYSNQDFDSGYHIPVFFKTMASIAHLS